MLTNTGTVLAAAGTVALAAHTVTNLVGGTLTGGTWSSTGGTLAFADPLSTLAATMVVSGHGWAVTAAGTGLQQALRTVAAGGSLQVLGDAAWSTSGTLGNAGEIRLAGTFAAAGITNTGRIDGTGTIGGAVTGSGTIEAAGGTLSLTQLVSGALLVDAGSTLAVKGGTAAGTTLHFAGPGAALQIVPGAQPFNGRVLGSTAGDTIDLVGVAATGTAAGSTLTLAAGGATLATLTFDPGTVGSLASDGHGGTLVTTVAANPDPLFDPAYYLAQNPDVAAAGVDPYQHYMASGWKEGRNPSALFNTLYYLNQNPDVRAAGVNPLTQFESSGWMENRDPSIGFSVSAYLAAYPDVKAAGIDPLLHYVQSGKAEGRTAFAATPHATGPADPLVDAAYVYAHNPAVAAAGLDASAWYNGVGWTQGANPDAFFDTSYYLTQNSDVRAAGIDPLAHFEAYGWHESRQPSLLFDDAKYLAAYPDVAAAAIDPLLHYLRYGQAEGRMAFMTGGTQAADSLVDAAYYDRQLGATLIPTGPAGAQQAAYAYDHGGWQARLNPDAFFDSSYYLTQNPDVRAAGIDPLAHFEAYGLHEGRQPSLLFDDAKYLAAYPDVAAAGLNPLLHYIRYGQAEGRMAFLPGGTQAADPLVDPTYYDHQLGATLIPGGPAGAQQAAYAYDHGGWQARLNPDALFDTDYYLSHNSDVAAAHVDPLAHYELHGWLEGRDPSAAFSTNKYLATYSDVQAAQLDPLLHYVQFGQAEGRAIFAA